VILVDTSVWIDHLHEPVAQLVALLESDEVGCHPLVIEELALGSLKRRDIVLGLLASLRQFPVLDHHEVLELVQARRLWGRGLSAADAHLLGSASLSAGARLWTRDKRLRAACRDIGVAFVDA
jgi:predicted nucleic acid-binding protein